MHLSFCHASSHSLFAVLLKTICYCNSIVVTIQQLDNIDRTNIDTIQTEMGLWTPFKLLEGSMNIFMKWLCNTKEECQHHTQKRGLLCKCCSNSWVQRWLSIARWKVRTSVVPAFIVVILDIQIHQFGKINSQSTASIINILTI